jgi:ribokinase
LEGRDIGDSLNYLGVFGHVNIDYIMDVPKLPHPNSSIEVTNVKRLFGGTGANIAATTASLGVKTSLASFVGEDFPDDFSQFMNQAGVDLTDLKVVRGQTTPTCRILTDPEQNQIGIMDQGPMALMDEYAVARHSVESCDIVHIGTGRPLYYNKVMTLARGLGKRVHFDPAQEIHYVYNAETFRQLLEMTDLLFLNESELETALKYLTRKDKQDLLEYTDTLIVTLGKKGSQIMTKNETLDISSIEPRTFKDPTGAGDAYRAGFYAGMNRNYGLEKCGLLGAAAASFAIEHHGTISKLPIWDDLIERIEGI